MKKDKIPFFSKNIKTLRSNSGMTLEYCAEKLGLPGGKTTFYAYEIGKAEPNLSILVKISNLFKVSTDKILREKIKVKKNVLYKKCVKCGNDVKSKTGRPLFSNYCNDCYWG